MSVSTLSLGINHYKCDTCDAQFSHSSNLKKHVRVHTGDKSYRYDTCGAKFSHSGTLKSKSHVSISTILNMELKLNDEKRKIAISVFCVCYRINLILKKKISVLFVK